MSGRLGRRDDRGAIVVLFAMMMSISLTLVAASVDIGYASQERRQAQNAADAGALAGAADITHGDNVAANVVALIRSYVAKNFGSVTWAGCTDSGALAVKPDAGESCISFDANPPSTQVVRVSIPSRQINAFFGGVASIFQLTITATAVATVGQPSSTISQPCVLCTLSNTNLQVGVNLQNGSIGITGGAVYVGGSLTCGPNGTMTSSSNNVVGTIGSSCSSGVTPAAVHTPAIADPLASLPAAPNYSSLTAQPDCSSGTAAPGIYNSIAGCTLTAGLYVIAGGSIGGNGQTSLVGHGVTIFLTCGTKLAVRACNPGEAGATMNAGGNGAVDLSACTTGPCATGVTQGLVAWFDRNNSATMVAHGNAAVSVIGTVYGKSVTVDVNGTPASTGGACTNGFCSQVVVQQVSFSGQGALNLTYTQTQNIVITQPATITQLSS